MPDTPTLLAEWQEPIDDSTPTTPHRWAILSCLGVAFLMAIVGWFSKQSNFYFGAGAVLAAGLVIWSEQRAAPHSRNITLTNEALQINKKSYPLSHLAGFWLEKEPEFQVINFEPRKRSFFPIAVLYPGVDREEVRSLLLQVLAEVEPRNKALSDEVNKIIRL